LPVDCKSDNGLQIVERKLQTLESYNMSMDRVAAIAASYFSHNAVAPESIPDILTDIAATLAHIESGAHIVSNEPLVPAVSVKKSVTPDFIVCLEDGKKFKSLKRHLRTHYNLTPDEYRAKWGLAHDYPMVAPVYAAARSQLAKTMGLGQRREDVKPVKKGK
jgi:predicted transcriptional regulator